MGKVTALPADPHEDPLDPERILSALPERERDRYAARWGTVWRPQAAR
jgi:hypothetical protein